MSVRSPVVLALVSVLFVSAVPVVVALLLPRDPAALRRLIRWLVCFAVGALLGASFLHLIPEALSEPRSARATLAIVLGGFLAFFVLERYLWAHQHDLSATPRPGLPPLARLNILGDGAHNVVDGMAIAAAYLTSPSLGVMTSIAVLLHEVPQEIGDYGILLHVGLERRRAVAWNVASGLAAFVGAVAVLTIGPHVSGLARSLVPFAAGGFVYIAAADLIPQLREESGAAQSSTPLVAIPLGIALTLAPVLFRID